MARRSPLADHWALDPDVTFLNHGSFGACPTAVLAVQRAWQDRMEREPVRWFSRELEPALDDARRRVGAFLGADPDDLAFVSNATTGVNTVLRSLRFQPGDRILAADHEYNAVLNAAAFVAERDGATLDLATLPLPVGGPDEIVERVLDAVRPRTRLVILSAITSPTAVVMPVIALAHALTDRGLEVLVDGAHAPGQVVVDISALEAAGVAYWTGNAHKWLCAPKGSAILWVRRDRQADIRPLTISHGANDARTDRSRFRLEFDWMGTDDWSAPLSIPAALDVMAGLVPGGWREIMARNHALAIAGRDLVCDRLAIEPPTPDHMLGAMAAIPLPVDAAASGARSPLDRDPIQLGLMERFGIEVPVGPWPTRWTPGRDPSAPSGRLLRLSAQLYNSLGAYELLAEGLAELLPGR
jgi:isopenicillin-N epimerase